MGTHEVLQADGGESIGVITDDRLRCAKLFHELSINEPDPLFRRFIMCDTKNGPVG